MVLNREAAIFFDFKEAVLTLSSYNFSQSLFSAFVDGVEKI